MWIYNGNRTRCENWGAGFFECVGVVKFKLKFWTKLKVIEVTDEELKELVASLAIDSKNLHEAQRKTDEQINRTDEQICRLEKQVENMARKIGHVADIVDGVSKNQGAVAEEFFYNSLAADTHLGTIHFDGIAPNLCMR